MRLPNPFQIFLETKLTDTGKGELMLSSPNNFKLI